MLRKAFEDLVLTVHATVSGIALAFLLTALAIMASRGYRPNTNAPIIVMARRLLVDTPLWSSARLVLANVLREA